MPSSPSTSRIFSGVRASSSHYGDRDRASRRENIVGKPAAHKPRYDEVADMMGCFSDDRRLLKTAPLQQIWQDHLLAGITRMVNGYADGLFVMLSPRDNHHVTDAGSGYREQLTGLNSFEAWSLENVVEKLKEHSDAAWIDAFHDRYLAFEKIDRMLVNDGPDP